MIYSEVLKRVKAEEEVLVFQSFSNDDAFKLGKLMSENALAKNLPITISIRRANGFIVFQRAMNGALPNNAVWLEAKHNSVMIRNTSTLFLHAFLKENKKSLSDLKLEGNYASLGGGFPIRTNEFGVIGTVCVSGLEHLDDHAFVVESLSEFLNKKISL